MFFLSLFSKLFVFMYIDTQVYINERQNFMKEFQYIFVFSESFQKVIPTVFNCFGEVSFMDLWRM